MKCPLCNNTNFARFREPLRAQYASLAGETYCCTECGYILWISPSFPKYYKGKIEEIKQIESKIEALIKERDYLKTQINNNNERKAVIKKMEKELRIRQSLGDDDKRTRALIESIRQEKEIVKTGVNPNITNMINNLEVEIQKLNREKALLEQRL